MMNNNKMIHYINVINEILNQADMMNLASYGNETEYLLEAKVISRYYDKHKNTTVKEFAEIITEVFNEYFNWDFTYNDFMDVSECILMNLN